jgi:hypothetical protein
MWERLSSRESRPIIADLIAAGKPLPLLNFVFFY